MQHQATPPTLADPIAQPTAPTRTSDTGEPKPSSGPSPRLQPVCLRCGSDALVRDASAVWSVPEQRWELVGTYDSTTCQACEAESDDLANWRPVAGDSAASTRAIAPGTPMVFHPGTGTLLAADEAVILNLDLEQMGCDEDETVAAALHAGGHSVPLATLVRDIATPSR